MHSKILGLIAHLLCAAGQPGAPTELPWEALPQVPDEDTTLEAVLLVRDLRAVHTWSQHVRQVLREVPVGEALTADGAGLGGLDVWNEVASWLTLASPGNKPVPAGLALMSTSGDLGWQGMLLATEDVQSRILAQHATPIDDANGLWKLPHGDRTFFVQRDARGWLRIAPDPHWLSQAAGEVPAMLHKAAAGFADQDVALVVLGQGTVARRLAHLSLNPAVQTLADSVRAGGVAWRLGDAQTTQVRLLLDAPLLETLAPVLRRRQLSDPFTRSLGDDLQGLGVLAVPPPFVKAFPNWVDTHLEGTAAAIPAPLHELLGHFEGHVAFVSYDAPGDWALAAQFDGDDSAAQMVPALQTWAQQLVAGLAPGGQQVLSLEPFFGTAHKVFHLRPEAHLEGPYVAARGPSLLFVQQRSRLQKLLAVLPAPEPSTDDAGRRGLFAAPMTPLMKETFAEPHMVSGYKVLGSDAAWLDYLVWVAGRMQAAAQIERAAQDGSLSAWMEHLPQWVGALSYLWLCTYDVGLTADVVGPLLVVDVTHSEI